MSIIRLRFKDINDEVIGDLEVSKEIPVADMLPLILKQLGLEDRNNWKLVLEQNRAIDPQSSFDAVGARDGAVIRVVAAELNVLPLSQEIFHSIVQPQSSIENGPTDRSLNLSKQDLGYIARQLAQQHHVLLALDVGIAQSVFVRHLRGQVEIPGLMIALHDFKSVKSVLREIAGELYHRQLLAYLREEGDLESLYRKLERWQVDELTKLVCDSLRGQGVVLVIGDLGSITPAGVSVLRQLLDVATALAAVSPDGLENAAALKEQFETIRVKRETPIDFLWISLVAFVLVDIFFILQRVNPLVAYIATLGAFLLALTLRAYLWRGPSLKMVKQPAAT
jgi:hypothetical protein